MGKNFMNYRNPQHNVRGDIDCEIDHPDFGWIPFTASENDPEQLGRELYQTITQAGGIAPYTPPPPPTDAELAAAERAKRDGLLAACDWTQLPDVSAEISEAWKPYRQALRDITDQAGFPTNIIYPTEPGA